MVVERRRAARSIGTCAALIVMTCALAAPVEAADYCYVFYLPGPIDAGSTIASGRQVASFEVPTPIVPGDVLTVQFPAGTTGVDLVSDYQWSVRMVAGSSTNCASVQGGAARAPASYSATPDSMSFQMPQDSLGPTGRGKITLFYDGPGDQIKHPICPGTGTFAISSSNGDSGSTSVTFTSSPGQDETTVMASPDTVDADGVDATTITVTVTNKHGCPLQDESVSLGSSGMSPPPSIAPASVTTDASGTAQFTVTSTEAGTATIAATVSTVSITQEATVTFVPVGNTPPTAADDGPYTVGYETSFELAAPGVLDNDADADMDPLEAVPAVGTTAQGGDYAIAADGSFTYLPPDGFSGADTFDYQITDQTDTSTATVLLDVASNPLPVALDDGYATPYETLLDVAAADGLLGNDADPNGDPITASLETPPGQAAAFSLDPDGSFEYMPLAGFSGQDSFEYRLSDGTGSVVASVTIDVASNIPPDAQDDGPYTVTYETLFTLPAPGVLGNDADAEGSLDAVLVAGPAHAKDFTLGSDGAFTYEPDDGYTGPDSFTYEAHDGTDGALATVSLNIVPPDNDPPVATDDVFQVPFGPTYVVLGPGVLDNDVDPESQPLQAIAYDGPTSLGGTLDLDTDGGFAYTPAVSGADTFMYTVTDGFATGTATITFDVLPNDVPVATDDAWSTPYETSLVVPAPGLLANDADPEGDVLTVALVDPPSYGSIGLDADGSFTYTPDAGFSGTDVFTYLAADRLDGTPATASIHVGLPDPPTASFTWAQAPVDLIPITFTGVIGADVQEIAWSVDGSPVGNTDDLVHTFPEPGTYTVSLTVTDLHSQEGTASHEIEVSAFEGIDAKMAVDGLPLRPYSELRLHDMTTSTTQLVSWHLDMGDGTNYGADAEGAMFSHRYAAAGAYTVVWTVQDEYGHTADWTSLMYVEESGIALPPAQGPPPGQAALDQLAPPVAHAGEAQQVEEGARVILDGSASLSGSGRGLTYTWVQTQGPTVSLEAASTPWPTFVAGEGPYEFRLVVHDGIAYSQPATVQITTAAPPQPPAEEEPLPRLDVDFSARRLGGGYAFEPEGLPEDAAVTWYFGDGGVSTKAWPQYAYERSGRYEVTMTVVTPDGRALTVGQTIHAAAAPAGATQSLEPVPDARTSNMVWLVLAGAALAIAVAAVLLVAAWRRPRPS